jgi:hypothetical protein
MWLAILPPFSPASFTFPHIFIFEYLDMFPPKSAKEKPRRFIGGALLVSLWLA